MKPEKHVIRKLGKRWKQLGPSRLTKLEDIFLRLRKTDDKVARISPFELYESQWSVLGIISRAYQLLICCIGQVAEGNWNGYYAAARGLLETLCFLAWALENPQRLPSLVRFETVRIGKITNAGYRKWPELKSIYSDLSSTVHPNRNAHLLGFRKPSKKHQKIVMSPFELDFSDYFAEQYVDLIIFLGEKINSAFFDLISMNSRVFKQGNVMLKVKKGNIKA